MRNTYLKVGRNKWIFVKIVRPGESDFGIAAQVSITKEIAQKMNAYEILKA